MGGYDEFSDRSFTEYPGGTSLQRWRRDLLRRARASRSTNTSGGISTTRTGSSTRFSI